MSQAMMYTFRLFGPRKGQTIRINGHQFVDGELRLVQSSMNMDACMRVFSFYGAFARGTDDYEIKMAKEIAEEKGNEDGSNEADADAKSGNAEQVSSDLQPAGSGPSESDADGGDGSTEITSGDSGSDSSRDGHEDAGIPEFEIEKDREQPFEPASEINTVIKNALTKLDPSNNDHWVNTGAHKGKPKLAAVEQAYGRAGLTRNDLESAYPGFDRDVAVEALLGAV